MQALIRTKSFGGSGLSCLIDLEGNVIISPTDLEPFLRLDDIFMKKSDDKVMSHIYQMQKDMQDYQGGVFTYRCGWNRAGFILHPSDELRLGLSIAGTC